MNRIFLRVGVYSLICLGISLLLSNGGSSKVIQDDVSSKLIGSWAGEGKAFGRPSRPEMKWESTLNGKFIKLSYRTLIQTPKGDEVFEGHGYYKSLGAGKYQGNWFDSQGSSHPISAVFANDALTANWGTQQTELGKTIYRLTSPDEMELIDSVQKKDGTWQEFGRARLKRK